MPKVMKAKKYLPKRQNVTPKKVKVYNGNFDFLTACHKLKFDELYNVIHFHPCNPELNFQTTASLLLHRIFLSILDINLVAFGNKTWK